MMPDVILFTDEMYLHQRKQASKLHLLKRVSIAHRWTTEKVRIIQNT